MPETLPLIYLDYLLISFNEEKVIYFNLSTNTSEMLVNPRPAGVWFVTRPAGGGGGQRVPLRSPKLLDRFPNFKRHSIALYVNYPYKVKNLTWRSLMTSQVHGWSFFGKVGGAKCIS